MMPETDALPRISNEQLSRFLTMLVIARNVTSEVRAGVRDGQSDAARRHLLTAADEIQAALGLLRDVAAQREIAVAYAPLVETLQLLTIAAKNPHNGRRRAAGGEG